MTVAATRTKAEQALARNFEAVLPRLPGGRAVAEARKAAIGVFAARGLPHRRIEQWKYTDLRGALKEAALPAAGPAGEVSARQLEAALGGLASLDAHRLVFVDGAYAPALSGAAQPKGLEFATLASALARPDGSVGGEPAGSIAPGQEAVVALNTAYMTDGAVLRVPAGVALDLPVLLVFVSTVGEARLLTTRNVLTLGRSARATVIEAHVALTGAAPGQANTLTDVALDEGASLAHLQCALAGGDASHLSTWLARIGADAHYRAFQFTAASGLVRNGIHAVFAGEGGSLDLSGAFLGRGGEHIDTTLVVDHAVPRCQSRELFKGVLAERARGVFQGKVIVRPGAQKSDGKQMAQALMLSQDAEFDSKPELEIHADDVVCGHGSTAAEIDEDLLFYMRARGIPPAEARALLIESFIGEAFDRIEDPGVRGALFAVAKARLDALSQTEER